MCNSNRLSHMTGTGLHIILNPLSHMTGTGPHIILNPLSHMTGTGLHIILNPLSHMTGIRLDTVSSHMTELDYMYMYIRITLNLLSHMADHMQLWTFHSSVLISSTWRGYSSKSWSCDLSDWLWFNCKSLVMQLVHVYISSWILSHVIGTYIHFDPKFSVTYVCRADKFNPWTFFWSYNWGVLTLNVRTWLVMHP